MFPCGARPSHWPGDSPRPPAPTGQACEALTCSILQLSLTWRDLWDLQPLVASSCALCWPRACRAKGGTVRHTQQALGYSSLGTAVGTSVCVLPKTLRPPVPMHSGLPWCPQPHTVSTHCFPVTVDAHNHVYLHACEQSTGTSPIPSGQSCPSSSPTHPLDSCWAPWWAGHRWTRWYRGEQDGHPGPCHGSVNS